MKNLFATVFLAMLGCQSVSADGKEWVVPPETSEDLGSSSQSLTGTHKICSAVDPNRWRDTISVPNSWTRIRCAHFAISVGVDYYQIGCTGSTYAWGSMVTLSGTPTLPPGNSCGW